MTDISYLHRFCASKWGWCWGLTLQAPNTSNTIQYASNIPDMAEIQSICTVFGHKLHGRGPAEKSAPACLVHGKTRPSLKHEAGMRMVQDESGWKRFDKRCDNAWQTVCGCLWMYVDVCGCLWCLCLVCGSCWRVEKKGTKQIYAARLGRGAVAVPNRNCHNFSCFHHFPFGPFRTQGRLLKTLTNSRKSSYKEWWVV
jgi:hypothetical protein